MKDYIRQRVLDVSNYILENKCTIRDAASEFKVSKSTICKDLLYRLPIINPVLNKEIRKHIEINIEQRTIRGGESTKKVWRVKNDKKNEEN